MIVSSSTVRSFRIDKHFSEIINSEAERMGISVNAMIKSVLKQYAEFTRFQSKLDMIVINREVFRRIINQIDEEEAYNLGLEMGKDIPNDAILFWKKHVSIDTVIEYIEKMICIYGHIGTFDKINDETNRIIVIRHRLGINGSKYLLGFIKSLFIYTVKSQPEISITDYSLKIQIPL